MNIAYTTAPGRGDTDMLLLRLAERLMSRGKSCAGIVQINTEQECEGPCDMDVQVLPDGPVLRISQNLGKNASGCRLDADALERAVSLVQPTLSAGAQLLIVNKFGKHEADGRGFRDTMADALAQDIPVIVGLNGVNKDAFETFTGGIAEEVSPELEALEAWVADAMR